MIKKSLNELLIGKFGEKLFEKSLGFPNNKINITFFREVPLKVNTIVLDNEREFHLIIDQNKKEIFHDCPSFLIYSEKEKKICIHLIKTLLIIKEKLSREIINEFHNYKLTSEDLGSKKKSKNFLLLANNCFEANNCVEGLSYLNKAIINQSECENIIQNYLERALENNLFLEFFDFLKSGCENELNDYFIQFNHYIEQGFIKFFNSLSEYSFFNILNIIESLNVILEYINFPKVEFEKFKNLMNSENFNEKYFSIYFVKKYFEKLMILNPLFKDIIDLNHLESSKNEITNYFLDEIENFTIIDKLKLMKRQFKIIEIPKEKYHEKYKRYKNEIMELERKIYLKKFSFLKLLMEKYNLKRSKGEFRKKRNTYNIKHDDDNLRNPVYAYIISHIGFYGPDNQMIKSNDIGINYFIIKELFLDDLTNHPDIFYYKNQFWGSNEQILDINSIEGISLFSESIDYKYDIDQRFSNVSELNLIEWDLANKPRQGSIVNAYRSQIIIPDYNNPLFHDLKPFDLCYCIKNPVKIEGNIIKTINVINKCSFNDAINSVSKGMTFIEGYYPLSLVRGVLEKDISPFKAYEIAINNPNKQFIPKYNQFIKSFREFLFNFINKERNYIFEEIKADPEEKANQILIILNLENELAGLDLPYAEIIEKLLDREIELEEFKTKILTEINSYVKNLIDKKEIGSTIIFNLKRMKNTPFSKYSNEIVQIRKNEFEASKVIKIEDMYDLSEIRNTYYGRKFSEILNLSERPKAKRELFSRIKEFADKLNLKLEVI